MIQELTDIKNKFLQHIHQLQNEICAELETTDGHAKFIEDKWERPGGGGGSSRIIQHGNVFEKGGVNVSAVEGAVTDEMKKQLRLDGEYFFAAGISLIIHPFNPFV